MAGTYYNTITLSHFAAQNPFTVASGGLISVANGYGIVGTSGYAWTLFNRGTIESSSGFGVDLTSGGLIVNGQSGSSAGLISGLGRGVRIDQASGTVINYGRIIATDGSGVVLYGTGSNTVVNFGSIVGILRLYGNTSMVTNSGSTGGVYVHSSVSDAVNNTGVIAGVDYGVSLLVGDSLTNSRSGSISGVYGVAATGASIVNYGTIIGTHSSGVVLRGSAALVTGGTITGLGTAVSFGYGTELLVIKPGAVFDGALSGFTITDTIDLASVSADSAVFTGTTAGGTLSAMDGTAVVESLVLAGRFANNFAVAPDGHGGVDVTIRQPTGNIIGGTYSQTVVLTAPNTSTTVTSTGRITAPSGPGVVNAVGVVGTLTNMGHVAATGNGGQGIYLGQGGFVSNSGGTAGGYISGAGVGVMIGGGAGTVTNSGTVAGGTGVAAGVGANLTVTNSGTIAGTAGTAVALAGGTSRLVVDPGAVFHGNVDGGGGASVLEIAGSGSGGSGWAQGGGAYVSLGSVANFSALQIDPSATLAGSGALSFATLVNQGQVVVASGDSLVLGTVASVAGTGVIDLRAGGAIHFTGPVADQTLVFNPAGGSAAIDEAGAFAATLADFTASLDTIDLTGLTFAGDTSVGFNSATDVLTVTEGGASATLQLDAETYAGITWSAKQDGGTGTVVTPSPCYCRGTMILTERGEVAVEELAIGDRVVTLSGMARPIKWIGHRSYDGRFAFGHRHILPVRITAGALADGVPRRDLWLSPNHALYLEDVLIEARDLVNGVSIVQADTVEAIEYVHIELDRHDVIVAEGAYAESFLDDDNRLLFHNAHEYRRLYPAMPAGLVRYCAPRRDQGWEVEQARALIARRAGLAVAAEVLPLGPLRGQIEEAGHRRIRG